MDSLVTFLRSGTVSGVSLGCSEAEVRGRLGDPDATSRTKPTMWKYGALELAFEASRVVMVLLTTEGGVDPAWEEATDRQRVELVLTEIRLPYEPVAELTFDTQSALRVIPSRAVLVFDTERDDRLVKGVVTAG